MILRLLFLLILLSSAFTAVEAQVDQPEKPRIVSGGIVNGKATNLVRPAYPAAARAVRAEGVVNVQVTIDEQGTVISAAAVSGHPLLRAAAVKAAQESIFSPTTLQGMPVKVTGVIVYNFVLDEPTPEIRQARAYFTLGTEIAGRGFKGKISPDAVLRMFPADWTAERAEILKLNPPPPPEPKKEAAPNEKSNSTVGRFDPAPLKAPPLSRAQSYYIGTSEPPVKLTPATTKIRDGIVSSVEQRLASQDKNLWWFNTGRVYAAAVALADSKVAAERRAAAALVIAAVDAAPAGVPAVMLKRLRANAERIDAGAKTADEMSALQATVLTVLAP